MTAKYVSRTLKAVSWDKTGMPLLSSCSTIYTSLPVLILALGAITGGKLILRLEISNLEMAFLPGLESSLINLVTLIGVTWGLVETGIRKSSYALSTLFFLTPLIYGRTKPFSFFMTKLKILDEGWIEPYHLLKDRSYFWGATVTQHGYWPNSRLIISSFFCALLILSGALFIS